MHCEGVRNRDKAVISLGFPSDAVVKNLPASAEDTRDWGCVNTGVQSLGLEDSLE